MTFKMTPNNLQQAFKLFTASERDLWINEESLKNMRMAPLCFSISDWSLLTPLEMERAWSFAAAKTFLSGISLASQTWMRISSFLLNNSVAVEASP